MFYLFESAVNKIPKENKIDPKLIESSKNSGNNKEKRVNELHNLIEKTYKSISNNTNTGVWSAPKNNPETLDKEVREDIKNVIQEIDRDTICWVSWRGIENKMARASFNNYLAKLRNP